MAKKVMLKENYAKYSIAVHAHLPVICHQLLREINRLKKPGAKVTKIFNDF